MFFRPTSSSSFFAVDNRTQNKAEHTSAMSKKRCIPPGRDRVRVFCDDCWKFEASTKTWKRVDSTAERPMKPADRCEVGLCTKVSTTWYTQREAIYIQYLCYSTVWFIGAVLYLRLTRGTAPQSIQAMFPFRDAYHFRRGSLFFYITRVQCCDRGPQKNMAKNCARELRVHRATTSKQQFVVGSSVGSLVATYP